MNARTILGALALSFFCASVAAQTINLQQPANVTITVKQLPVTTQTITIKNDHPTINVKVDPASSKLSDIGVTMQARSGPVCGGVVNGQPQKDCDAMPAKFESAAIGTCPQGSFFDIGKWQCWTCPPGYGRSIFPVDSDRACTKPDASIRGKFGPANYRGPFCPAGSFHDPIRGGECYSCPSDFRRSILHVNSDQACHKPGREELFKATRHQNTIWPHDCRDGRFHDIWDGGACWSCPGGRRTAHHINRGDSCARDIREEYRRATLVTQARCQPGEFHDLKIPGQQDTRTGGGCWTCPKEPQAWDRTVFPVDGQQACELGGGHAIAKGKFVSNLTCPAGQIFDLIGLNQGDINNRPELKGRSQQAVASGTCWSCPTGYDRTMASVKSGNACAAKTIGWFTAPVREPGLFGLTGAAEVLADVAKRHPALLKTAVEETAKSAAKGTSQNWQQLAEKEWQNLASRPHESTAATAVLLTRILAAVASPSQASAAERQAAEAFKQYVIARRSYFAQDALAQYDAWKTADDYQRSRRSQQGPQSMTVLLDYGTVPPDFSKLALLGQLGAGTSSIAVGVAAGALPVLGDVIAVTLSAAGNGFADFSEAGSAVKFLGRQALELAIGKAAEQAVQMLAKSAAQKITQDAIALGLVKGAPQAATRVLTAASSSGPQIIIGASLMILSIAVDQVEQIQNARPRLEAALATAKADPQLARLANSEAGMAELLSYMAFLSAGEVPMPSPHFGTLTASLETAKATQVASAAPSTAKTVQAAQSAAFNWVGVPGKAQDIAVGANGAVWHIGTDARPGGFGIYRWANNNWANVPGGAVKVAVDPQGNGWVLNDKNVIFRWDGGKFVQMPGAAREIAVGANGAVWVIGTNSRPGGFDVYRWSGNGWTNVPGGAVKVAVDPQGNAWVANDRKEIFRWDGQRFVNMPGLANALGIGANGTVWHLGTNTVQGGYGLWWWNNGQWAAAPGGLTELSVGPDGRVWGANSNKDIFRMQ